MNAPPANAAALRPLTIRASTAALALACVAMATSAIVFSEPAPVDVLMMGLVVLLPLLGVVRLGRVAITGFTLWLVVVATGYMAALQSPTLDTATIHLAVTLYLAALSMMLAGFIAADPRRLLVLLWAYVIGAALAALAAVVGYFDIVPGFQDLFTNYGRARGTFKDPNVLGAALAPAVVFLIWQTLRADRRRAIVSALGAAFIGLAVLLSFSRGAWISLALSLAVVGVASLAHARRRADFRRLLMIVFAAPVLLVAGAIAVTQVEPIAVLLEQRASLDQSYDQGPEGRFGGQAKAWSLILDNPQGIGTHTFRERHHHEEAHNVYLSMALSSGWLGGFAYLGVVLLTLAAGLRDARLGRDRSGLQLVVTASFAGLAFEGAVIDTDHWRHFFLLQAFVWGLADAPEHAFAIDPDARRAGDRAG